MSSCYLKAVIRSCEGSLFKNVRTVLSPVKGRMYKLLLMREDEPHVRPVGISQSHRMTMGGGDEGLVWVTEATTTWSNNKKGCSGYGYMDIYVCFIVNITKTTVNHTSHLVSFICFQISILDSKRGMNVGIFLKQFKK